ncbi:TIR domain-containing protein [Streptacidiphilus sp. N1-12]|uniref:TIR domain-containing protein n=2 Tax=Streptacidiphilus alkalitolerans TaxID=3342712 RepID=A0ABV6VAI6_9ACTN
MSPDGEQIYDLAVSFAGEHRDYVERAVRSCQQRGLRVFYDRDMNNEWWGRSFIREQREVYSSRTRYFVPFISTEYLAKPIPMDEFSAAMMTAVKQGDGYILPVLMDEVQVPSDLLHPHIHYLRAKDYSPEQLAEQLHARVRQAENAGQQAREVGEVVQEALNLRLPKVVPAGFSKYEELQVVFDYFGSQFQTAAPLLRPRGFICTVNRIPERISVRIEHNGQTVYSLDIYKGGNMGDDKLTFGLGHHRSFSNGINGWAEPFFDRAAEIPKLKMLDFSLLGSIGGSEREFTKEGLFNALWERIVDQLEQHR